MSLVPASRAIVPIMARAMVRKATWPAWTQPRAKRARYTANAIVKSYQALARMNRGARTIQRAYRKAARRRKEARGIGQRVGTSSAKTKENTSSAASAVLQRSDRTLYDDQILYPAFGDLINERERRIINLRGIKICMEISASTNMLIGGAYRDRYLYVNVALVVHKKNPTATTITEDNWFRGNAGNRGEDFTGITSSIGKSCTPINTDEYHVFMHKRFTLGGEAVETRPTVKRVMEYVKIGRQIRFDAESQPDTRFFLVWWAALAGEDTATPFTSMFKAQWRNTLYYREPKA